MPLTDLDFLEPGSTWPPPSEKARLDRYEKNRKLWKGEHDEIFGNWWRVLLNDTSASLELIFNWHKRLTTLWADLLLSEPPTFLTGEDKPEPPVETPDDADPTKPSTPEDEPGDPIDASAPPPKPKPRPPDPMQEALDRLAGKKDNSYVTTLYEIALDMSRYGDGLAKIRLKAAPEGATISAQPPTYWFPVVAPNDLREYTHHVLAWTIDRGQRKYLWSEVHEKGKITYYVQRIEGNLLGVRESLEPFAPGHVNAENTQVDDFLVVPFAGLRASDDIYGVDDYADLDTIIQTIEVRAGQINRVLDKHTDPTISGPPDQLEPNDAGEMVFASGGRYIEVLENDVRPEYMVWDGRLEAQFTDLEFLIEQLYVLSHTSPAAFGQLKDGLVESGSALKRLMQAPLAKVARITMRFDPAARRALNIASQLEAANGRGTPILEDILIQWQDGLPPDAKEQAETESIRTGAAQNSSLASAIRRLDGGTQEEAEEELLRIEEENSRRAQAALSQTVALQNALPKPDPADPNAPPPAKKQTPAKPDNLAA